MITELNPKEEYKKSFTDLNTLKEELENNPFGKVVLYIEEDSVIAYLYYSEIYERVEINNIEEHFNFNFDVKGWPNVTLSRLLMAKLYY